jgi:hypothetical protein
VKQKDKEKKEVVSRKELTPSVLSLIKAYSWIRKEKSKVRPLTSGRKVQTEDRCKRDVGTFNFGKSLKLDGT